MDKLYQDCRIFLERTYTKDQEIQHSKVSSLQSQNVGDIHVKVQYHPGSRALERRPDMKKHHWDDIIKRTVHSMKDKPAGHYLTYSKKHQQGIVHEWMPHKKRLELISTLPKGRSNPRPDTQKHIIEGIEYDIMEIIEIN